jgi:hypothetical protein
MTERQISYLLHALRMYGFSYSDDHEKAMVGALKFLRERYEDYQIGTFFTYAAKTVGTSEDLMESVYYALVGAQDGEGNELFDYGTSPRGMWMNEYGAKFYDTIMRRADEDENL